MAHTAIGQIGPNDAYELGTYRFTVAYAYDQSLNATTLQALCGREGHELKAATKKVAKQAEIVSWSIEANDTTADVYAVVKIYLDKVRKSDFFPNGIKYGNAPVRNGSDYEFDGAEVGIAWKVSESSNILNSVGASKQFGTWESYNLYPSGQKYNIKTKTPSPFTHQGKTVYVATVYTVERSKKNLPVNILGAEYSPDLIAWTAIYGEKVGEDYEIKEVLIGRFAIDPHEAGATGPDSFWIDPLDWNIDPTTVLNLTVDGALSGRHNDPLNENADYSYIPTDREKATGYGFGGNGGHGGGGGGGASTIVVNRFATDRANSKNIVTKPKRHGYGSGGGKGGEGGDGCILIYY